MSVLCLSGRIVDVCNRAGYPGTVEFADGVIRRILHDPHPCGASLILPGLVDAHIQIESSMLSPSEFARLAFRLRSVCSRRKASRRIQLQALPMKTPASEGRGKWMVDSTGV